MRKVIGLDGREYSWNLGKYTVYKNDDRIRSQYHKLARKTIREIYHSYSVCEEVKLPGSSKKGSYLFLDFFIPRIDLAIEVHGPQHYHHVAFFHKTRADFIKALNRDDQKQEWCELNGIDFVVLKYSDLEDDWKQQLRKRTSDA